MDGVFATIGSFIIPILMLLTLLLGLLLTIGGAMTLVLSGILRKEPVTQHAMWGLRLILAGILIILFLLFFSYFVGSY